MPECGQEKFARIIFRRRGKAGLARLWAAKVMASQQFNRSRFPRIGALGATIQGEFRNLRKGIR
jgi:hypothetical protein